MDKLKICLFNPIKIPTYPPLNLTYLASYLKKYSKYDFDIKLIDINCSNNPVQDILNFNPDVLGFTTLSSHLVEICNISSLIRKRNKNILLVCGGAHATVTAQDLLFRGNFDIAVIGEGEVTFKELVEVFVQNNKVSNADTLRNLKGIAFKNQDKVEVTVPRDLINDLDTIPHPERNLLNNSYYHNRYYIMRGMNTYGVATIAGSRGCPYSCIFCCVNFTTAGKVRFHSARYIVDEMEELLSRYKTRWLFFTDDTFLINKQHTNNLCQEIIHRGLNKKIKWECQVRSNLVTENNFTLLKLMKQAGCEQIDYGFESGNQRVLTLIKGNNITLDDHQRAIDLTNKAGIKVLGTFILGTPTETYDELLDTKNFILKNYKKLYRFQLTFMIAYPGTKVYELAVKHGVIGDNYYEELQKEKNSNVEHGMRIISDSVSASQVLSLRKELDNLSFKKVSFCDKLDWLVFNLISNRKALLNGIKWIFNTRYVDN